MGVESSLKKVWRPGVMLEDLMRDGMQFKRRQLVLKGEPTREC